MEGGSYYTTVRFDNQFSIFKSNNNKRYFLDSIQGNIFIVTLYFINLRVPFGNISVEALCVLYIGKVKPHDAGIESNKVFFNKKNGFTRKII